MSKKDQVGLIKTKSRDIIMEIDRKYGYALLAIVKKKDRIITKSINRFMVKFEEINKKYLENLGGLIDVSSFKGTTAIINEIFYPYIAKK